jgi:hypothetical protein
VEVYQGKPIMYCLANSATDWIRMRPNKEGLVARVLIEGHKVRRLSLVPLTRDAENNPIMLDPSADEGAKLIRKVQDLSAAPVLKVESKEAGLIGLPK